MDNGRIETSNGSLGFRALLQEDLEIVRAWFQDLDTRRWLGGPDWPLVALKLSEVDGNRHAFLVSSADVPIGLLDVETYADRSASVAIVIDPRLRGRGFASAVLDRLPTLPRFAEIDRFLAGVERGNIASERLARATGFVQTTERDEDGFAYFVRRSGRLEDRAGADKPRGADKLSS